MQTAIMIVIVTMVLMTIWVLAIVYIELRKGLNALLETAQKDFAEAANAIMKTPDDVPAEALRGLIFMGEFATDKRSSWEFLRYLRGIGVEQRETLAQPGWRSELRPELRVFFDQAAGAAFAILINTFTFTGLLIRITMAQQSKPRRANSRGGNGLGPVEGKVLAFTDQHHFAA
jgi:hypothetical protein